MNFEKARFNMLEQQIRPWRVVDADVLSLLSLVRREEFVPAERRAFAFADIQIPLGFGAAMLAPKVEAQILQALKVHRNEKVLEVGTGTGYLAALLAAHADHVWSMEIVPELAVKARENLERQHIANVSVETGDGMAGLPVHAPFDAIVVSGGVAAVPRELLAQLKVGGRLFAIVGTAPSMTAQMITRATEDGFRTVGLFETEAALLHAGSAKQRFVF